MIDDIVEKVFEKYDHNFDNGLDRNEVTEFLKDIWP